MSVLQGFSHSFYKTNIPEHLGYKKKIALNFKLILLFSKLAHMNHPRICIIEDDPIIATEISYRLKELGYIPLGPFASGEEAFDSAQKEWPDLVIMDIQLEGEWDGIETSKYFMKQKPLPIIFLTANTDSLTFNQAKLSSPAAFISKPFRRRDLEYAIELALCNLAAEPPLARLPEGSTASYLLDDRLFIKTKERFIRVLLEDIHWVEADDYACKIATHEKEYYIGKTLGKIGEVLLHNPAFVRIHRSYIVNINHIEQISDFNLFIGNKNIPMSKSYKSELYERILKI